MKQSTPARSAPRREAAPLPGAGLWPDAKGLQAILRSRWAYVLVSMLLLIPCWWQPHIQAGDLSSHIYNAWLAQLIRAGKAPGFSIVPQTTNVLFDLVLSGLFETFGPEAAQRIAASLAVLIFAWGAFAFVTRLAGGTSGKPAWRAMPSIALLAYGWVFHMGFFNFYLSLGLCLAAMTLAGDFRSGAGGLARSSAPSPVPRPQARERAPSTEWNLPRIVAAAALLALAYVAHALPVAWSAALLVYVHLERRLARIWGPRGRAYLAVGSLVALLLARVTVGIFAIGSHWGPNQIVCVTGLDQAAVYDGKYNFVVLGLLIVWASMAAALLRQSGWRKLVHGIPFQFYALTAVGIFLIPNLILIPGYKHALVYIANRMSLAAAICLVAMVASAPRRRFHSYAMTAVLLLYFGLLYRDERILNRLEDRIAQAAATLAPNQRVISAIDDPGLRVNAITHMIDRACVGRCYSYANYEPSTAQFRIRVSGESPLVAATYIDSWQLQTGRYVVRPRDLPLFQIDLDPSGNMVVRPLEAGKVCGATYYSFL